MRKYRDYIGVRHNKIVVPNDIVNTAQCRNKRSSIRRESNLLKGNGVFRTPHDHFYGQRRFKE